MRSVEEIIAAVSGAEFEQMNPHLTDSGRVEAARIIAEEADLTSEELIQLDEWANAILDGTAVHVILTHRERDRLAERLRETFNGDRGAVLGFTEEDRALARRFGVELQPSKGQAKLETAEILKDLSFPSGPVSPEIREMVDLRLPEYREEARLHLEYAAVKLEDVKHHTASERDPVLAVARNAASEALAHVERGIEALEQADFEARGIPREEAQRRVGTYLEEYRRDRSRRTETSPSPGDWAKDYDYRQRLRLRQAARASNSALPAAARTNMEPPVSSAMDTARMQEIEDSARALLKALRPKTAGSNLRFAEVLLKIEAYIRKQYDTLEGDSIYYVHLNAPATEPARRMAAAIRRAPAVTTENVAFVLRTILRWITDQAVCFKCKELGQACSCE